MSVSPSPLPAATGLRARRPFEGYAYSYPHKTAYRSLAQPVRLADLWRDELARQPERGLFLYIHVPYCEARCGFCNLFTQAHPAVAELGSWLDAAEREARVVADALGPERRFARLAMGGGTPTILPPADLDRLLALAAEVLGGDSRRLPTSVEVSPATATPERLDVLAAREVDRISIGVQSFDEAEARELGRPQRRDQVEHALGAIRERAFPELNVDLIYGARSQSEASWARSLEAALAFEPEEIYLYPLYVRAMTGLDRVGRHPDDAHRLALYRAGRRLLLDRGWRQRSMRHFRAPWAPAERKVAPEYACQEDGMVGIGPGARSYTEALHYSGEYAVSRGGVRDILREYRARTDEDFAFARHGFWLDADERRRRWVIKSLLQVDGVDRARYRARFGRDVLADGELPALRELVEVGWAELDGGPGGHLRLNDAGLERSDLVGPWLASAQVRGRMADYTVR